MKNWKTTLIGFGTGLLYMFLTYLSSGLKLKDAALAVGLAVLGKVAADAPAQK